MSRGPSGSAAGGRRPAAGSRRRGSRRAATASRRRPDRRCRCRRTAGRAMNRVEAARSSGSRPPWTIPKRAWSGPAVRGQRAFRPAMGPVRRLGTTARGDDGKTGWSKATATSEPSASWTAIASSGVNRWTEPSRWLRNVTPSSSTTRRSPSETTWKPPESVRIGPSQSMNRCSPPSRSIRSWPGPQVEVVGVGQDDRGARSRGCRPG